MRRAIIGGTGVYKVEGETISKEVDTQFGSVTVDIRTIDNREIIFLPRHGKDHTVPPHLINYRANMMALKHLEVTHVYATCAVGSCNPAYAPGDVVILTDFLDFTKTRTITFYDGKEGVKHTDMSDPYCINLRKLLKNSSRETGLTLRGEAVYVCTEGPRFETAAEIRIYRSMGGDVVGMTNVPEVVLAKELGICYAAVGIITNWCTGIKSEEIAIHDIKASMERNREAVTGTFVSILTKDPDQDHCSCKKAVMSL